MTSQTTSFVRRAAIGLAAAATLTVTACGNDATTAGGSSSSAASSPSSPSLSTVAASPSSGATSSMSSSSGSTSSTQMPSGSSPADSAANTAHNAADVTFVQMMIPHHQGAIEMAELVPSRSSSQSVKELAAQVQAAQGPEIEQMTSWLQAWGVTTTATPAPASSSADAGMGGMHHGGAPSGTHGDMGSSTQPMSMPGEMSHEQMQALAAATGADFDRMWLEMMIEHHDGAVEMAQTEIEQGTNPDAVALAESIKTSQAEEIATMQQLLQTL